MLGNGDGTFGTPTTVATSTSPWLSAVGDFNKDGKLDLAVSSQLGPTVNVLLGNGDGTFQSKMVYAVGGVPYPLAIADINGDGMPDLIVPNASTSSVGVLLGTQWTAAASVPNIAVVGSPTTHLVTANFGGDADFLSSVSSPVGLVNGQAPQTITFLAPPTPLVYGSSPTALTATASSGLPITYTVTGPATVNGSALSITGAGTVVVTAAQIGNANYAAAKTISKTITVTKAALTVTANNATMMYGTSVPTFTASYAGFVNGDTVGVLAGSPSLTTAATSTSAAGNYNIACAAGTLASSNYSFALTHGTLTITAVIAATPSFSLAAGTYTGTQHLTITDASPGVNIYYTTNGTTPTTSSNRYTTALTLSTSETVQAIAVLSPDYSQSSTMSAVYVIK